MTVFLEIKQYVDMRGIGIDRAFFSRQSGKEWLKITMGDTVHEIRDGQYSSVDSFRVWFESTLKNHRKKVKIRKDLEEAVFGSNWSICRKCPSQFVLEIDCCGLSITATVVTEQEFTEAVKSGKQPGTLLVQDDTDFYEWQNNTVEAYLKERRKLEAAGG